MLLVYLAMLPLYADTNSPIYPTVEYADRWMFPINHRSATFENWRMAKTICFDYNDSALWIALTHQNAANVRATKEYLLWVFDIYNEIDNLAMYYQWETDYREDVYQNTIKSLKRLRLLLGPDNYYRGIVPQIPIAFLSQ